MGFGDWIVGCFIQFSTNGPQTIGRLQGSIEGLNDRIRVQNGLMDRNASIMALQRRRMEELRATNLRYAATGMGVASLAIGAGLVASVKEAAEVQQKLNLYQMQTGASQREMLDVQKQVFETARMTAQSAGNVADQFVTIAQMNLPMNLMSSRMLDQMAKYSDVVNLASRGQISTSDALKIGISTAHQLGIYDAKGVLSVLTAEARESLLLPHGLQRFGTQVKYYAPWIRMFGDSPENINSVMALGNLIDISGLSTGRGGTSVRAFLQALVPSLQMTKHLQSGKLGLLRDMHLLRADNTPTSLVTDKQGRTYINPEVFTDALYTYAQSKVAGKKGADLIKARSDIVAALSGTFTAQGGLWSSVLSSTGMAQLKNWHERYSKTPKTIDEMQAKLLDTFSGSVQKFETSVERFGAALAMASLPTLARGLNSLARDIDGFTGYFVRHPVRAKLAFAGLATGAGVLGMGALGLYAAPWLVQLFGNRGIAQSLEALKAELQAAGSAVKNVSGLVDQFGRPLRTIATDAPEAATGIRGVASALRLIPVGSGVTIAIAAVAGLIYGLVKNAQDAANNPRFAALINWANGGANYGINPPPGTFPAQDPVTGALILPKNMSRKAWNALQSGADFDKAFAPQQTSVNIHGPITVAVPKGTTQAQAQALLQRFKALGNTSAVLSNGQSVRAAAATGI